MKVLALLLLVLGGSFAKVRDMGYCPDVMSAECKVRAYFPLYGGQADGIEAYWLESTYHQVCFVTRKDYGRANIGQQFDCIWRSRRG